MAGKNSTCHVPVAKVSSNQYSSSTCLQCGLHTAKPTTVTLAQITHIPRDIFDIEMRKTHKIGGVSAIITPRSQSEALHIRIIYRPSGDLSDVYACNMTFRRPAPIA